MDFSPKGAVCSLNYTITYFIDEGDHRGRSQPSYTPKENQESEAGVRLLFYHMLSYACNRNE